jgi:MFS superfamily sulfate permease-like transporter
VARDPAAAALSYTDIAVWLVTFALTVFADLTVAVEVGMVLAALLFIRRVAGHDDGVEMVTEDYVEGAGAHPAGQGRSRLRRHLPHPRPVPVRRHRQAREGA